MFDRLSYSSFTGVLVAFFLTGCAGIHSRFHEVKSGEDLVSIARRYDVPVRELARFNGKRVDVVKKPLRAGAKLYIPFEESAAWDGESEVHFQTLPNANIAGASFSWPLRGAAGGRRGYGVLTSGFGWRKRRMHDGIDLAASTGTPVMAARSGHVLYAGNRISGYGNVVILKHADSFSTVYAHLSKMDVKKGQFVSRGNRLGRVGKTGRATAPHLHFEIRNQSVPVDPLLYLQGQYTANRISAR